MIGIVFALSGMLLLLLQVAAMDAILAVQALSREVERDFGHDTKIFPDHEQN